MKRIAALVSSTAHCTSSREPICCCRISSVNSSTEMRSRCMLFPRGLPASTTTIGRPSRSRHVLLDGALALSSDAVLLLGALAPSSDAVLLDGALWEDRHFLMDHGQLRVPVVQRRGA